MNSINYGNGVFWEKRYKEAVDPFDWLEGYKNIKPILQKAASVDARILYVGCGTSSLQDSMYDDGWTNITCVDFSKEVIKQHISRMKKTDTRHDLKYQCMDVTKMDYPDDSFDVVIDKCLLDAVLCAEDSIRKVMKTLREISRVLVNGGTYLMFSHGSPRKRLFYLNNKLVRMKITAFRMTYMSGYINDEVKSVSLNHSVRGKYKAKETADGAYCYVCENIKSNNPKMTNPMGKDYSELYDYPLGEVSYHKSSKQDVEGDSYKEIQEDSRESDGYEVGGYNLDEEAGQNEEQP